MALMEDSTVAVGGENDESECYIGKMALSLMLAWFFFFYLYCSYNVFESGIVFSLSVFVFGMVQW